jgi:hypothetical protein
MVEHLGQRDPAREAVLRRRRIARHLVRQPATYMGANARIVTAKFQSQMAVPLHVIGADADAATGKCRGDIAAK